MDNIPTARQASLERSGALVNCFVWHRGKPKPDSGYIPGEIARRKEWHGVQVGLRQRRAGFSGAVAFDLDSMDEMCERGFASEEEFVIVRVLIEACLTMIWNDICVSNQDHVVACSYPTQPNICTHQL